MSYFAINSEIKYVKGQDELSKRKTLITSPDNKLQIAEFHDKKGSITRLPDGPPHRHPQDMICYLVSGKIRETIGDESKILIAGDSWYVPSNIEHESFTIVDSVMICMFTPAREEYK